MLRTDLLVLISLYTSQPDRLVVFMKVVQLWKKTNCSSSLHFRPASATGRCLERWDARSLRLHQATTTERTLDMHLQLVKDDHLLQKVGSTLYDVLGEYEKFRKVEDSKIWRDGNMVYLGPRQRKRCASGTGSAVNMKRSHSVPSKHLLSVSFSSSWSASALAIF